MNILLNQKKKKIIQPAIESNIDFTYSILVIFKLNGSKTIFLYFVSTIKRFNYL